MEQEHNTPEFGLTEADKQNIGSLIRDAARMPDPPEEEEVKPVEPKEPDPTFLSETGAALAGGAVDAVESVGGFAELVGDTFKTGVGQLFGQPVDESQNPFSPEYDSNDAGWLDVPDDWVPENKTGLGKLARGLVEFGALTVATGGIGGAVGGGLRVGARLGGAARAANLGLTARRRLNFVGKAAKIGAEGGVADLVSSSSETENMANLLNEHTPWLAPWVTEALANDPEDNPWLARIKTVTAGAGLNWVGWGISAFAKGAWAAAKARRAGKSVDEANEIGNKVHDQELEKAKTAHTESTDELAKKHEAEGRGQSDKADPDNPPEAFVNPAKFDSTERATVDNTVSATQVARESIKDAKLGGEGKSHSQMLTDSMVEQIARGDKTVSYTHLRAHET